MSNKQYLPIVVAIIAVLVVAAAVACVIHKDKNNSGGDDETYYYYISSTDTSISGWHSATGKDAADAFANAMKADNIVYEFNDWGYLSKIGDQAGSWYSAMYLYGNTSKTAADNSILYPVTDSYGSYYASNGWRTIYGYDDSSRTGDKLWEMNGNVFFFSLYDPTTYAHTNPTTDTKWMGVGPFESTKILKGYNEEYHFYISCGGITGWYSATGKDSADAFANAMKTAGLDYTINQYGYLSKIGDYDGTWYSAMYNYGNTSKVAAENSILSSINGSYGYYAANGWMTINGYDDSSRAGDKLWQMNANVFFFSMYNMDDYSHPDPATDTRWMISGPFGDDEFYYFYISTDQSTGGWHTGVGADAAEAFANAMKADRITYEINDMGYLSRIGNESGSWYSAMYLYSNTSKTAAENSIVYSVKSYGSYYASNGWRTICGYEDSSRTGDKLWEMNGNVFFFSLYDPTTYAHTDPTTDTKWMGAGPFESTKILKGYNEEYYFYISCGEITGWYSATGVDAAVAFANAMKSAGLEYTINSLGYLSKIGNYEGLWYSAMYNYGNTSKLAAEASVKYSVKDWGLYYASNGWMNISGYNDSSRTGDKLWEMNGNVFFFSMYNEDDFSHPDPTTDTRWMTSAPFGGDEFYYFYISTDASTGGWHSATGKDAADAFANAMNADNIAYEINQYGYISKIGNESGSWYSAMYLYSNTSETAAENSILELVNDSHGSYYSSNGWKTIFGYDDASRTGDKLWEMNGNVFFFSLYGGAPSYSHTDPTTDTKWMTTGPFESTTYLKSYNEEYHFYISCDKITGWYSATGVDAADAFANAMKSAGLEYTFNEWGYLSKIGDYDGTWYSAMYNYDNTSKLAADASVQSPVENYGMYYSSNGWISVCGYDDSSRTGDKLWEMNGNVFFFSLYDESGLPINPTTTIASWSTTGPFA